MRNATIVINQTLIFLFTAVQEKNKVKYKLSHKMDKSSILAYQIHKNEPTEISFLYSLNSCLSNLVKITLDLLTQEKIQNFIQLCNSFNITN